MSALDDSVVEIKTLARGMRESANAGDIDRTCDLADRLMVAVEVFSANFAEISSRPSVDPTT
jgi:hypothetical protein